MTCKLYIYIRIERGNGKYNTCVGKMVSYSETISYRYKLWNSHLIILKFVHSICDVCGMPTGDVHSSRHLVRPILDLHMFYLLRQILFPKLVIFFRTMHLDHLSVLYRFCFVVQVDNPLIFINQH